MLILRQSVGSPIEGTGSPVFINKWVAAHNPVIIEFQRLDFQFISITDDGGKQKLNLPLSNPNHVYQVNDFIPVFTTAPDYLFEGFFKILSIDVNGNPTIDRPFFMTGSGSFNSNRIQNYHIEIAFGDGTSITSTPNEIAKTIRATTNEKGELRIDISSMLRFPDGMNLETDITPNGPLEPFPVFNRRDIDMVYKTNFFYRENRKGVIGTYVLVDEVVKGVRGAFQPRHKDNGYYNDYVVTGLGNLAKPLTMFKRPKYTVGLPFDVQYIIDEEAANFGLNFRRRYYLDDGTMTSQFLNIMDVARYDAFTRVAVRYDAFLGDNPNASRMTYELIDLNTPANVVTELTNVDIEKIVCSGYYLRWRNTLGGVDYWHFDNKENENFVVEGRGLYAKFNDSIEELDSTGEWAGKSAADQYQLSTRTTKDNLEGFKDLLSSPKVQIYLNGEWFTFLIQPQTFRTKQAGNLVDIELTGTMPEKQIQTA